MRLIELFDSKINWTKTSEETINKGATSAAGDEINLMYEFETTSGIKYEVEISGIVFEDTNMWDIMFLADLGHRQTVGLTGKGDEFEVFSTVLEIIENFIKTKNPDIITLYAHEPSRQRLYKSIGNRLVKQFGYDMNIKDNTKFKFIKADK